jgi:hypothetical protein
MRITAFRSRYTMAKYTCEAPPRSEGPVAYTTCTVLRSRIHVYWPQSNRLLGAAWNTIFVTVTNFSINWEGLRGVSNPVARLRYRPMSHCAEQLQIGQAVARAFRRVRVLCTVTPRSKNDGNLVGRKIVSFWEWWPK